jgi:hypothetical protein
MVNHLMGNPSITFAPGDTPDIVLKAKLDSSIAEYNAKPEDLKIEEYADDLENHFHIRHNIYGILIGNWLVGDLLLLEPKQLASEISTIRQRVDEIADREEAYIAEQTAALHLVWSVFKNISDYDALIEYEQLVLEPHEQQIILYATELFIKNNNPNTDLMALLIHHVSKTLPPEQVKNYAAIAIEAGRNKYIETEKCMDCTQKITKSISKFNDTKKMTVQAGIDKLSKYQTL